MDRQRNIDNLVNMFHFSPLTGSNSNNSPENMNLAFLLSSDDTSLFTPPGSLRRNDADIERIARIFADIDQRLRLVGLPDQTANRNNHILRPTRHANSAPANADVVAYVDLSETQDVGLPGLRGGQTANRNNHILRPTRRENSAPANADVVGYVDLSETPDATPDALRPVRRGSSYLPNGDEVVIVASNVAPVIDLCSPATGEATRPRPSTHRRMATNRNNYSTDSVADDKLTDDDNGKKDSSVQNPLICPVCLESFLQGRPTGTKCGHVFCEDCIRRVISLTRKCPVCNVAISFDNLFRLYF